MDAADYLRRAKLSPDILGADLDQALAMVDSALLESRTRSVPSTPKAFRRLYQYQVPLLSTDGSCPNPDKLDPTPYDLGAVLGGHDAATTLGLLALDSLVEFVSTQLDIGWLGIYQSRRVAAGPALVKLAYRGKPSRAEFPLTEGFARGSTNAAVGLSGEARVIDDVPAHVAEGGAYYTCDLAVLSEACLPILDGQGRVTGIVDAEHSRAAYFTPARLAWLVALCLCLDGSLPPEGLRLAPGG